MKSKNPRKWHYKAEAQAVAADCGHHARVMTDYNKGWVVVRESDGHFLCQDDEWRDCTPCPVA